MKDLKQSIHEKIDQVKDEFLLREVLRVLDRGQNEASQMDLFKNADIIMSKHENLFRRLVR